MKLYTHILAFCSLLVFFAVPAVSQETHDHDHSEEEAFEYTVGEVNYFTGEGVNFGGFIFPELFVNATGGVFEPGTNPSDLATTEHDPQNEAGVQSVEIHFDININETVTGIVYAAGFQGEDEWEAVLEEALLHYHINDQIAIGGGQFLNHFGWQAHKHIHQWDYVNHNLPNTRLLNEGELITQGGELVFTPNDDVRLIIGAGGVRSHAHEHEEEEHEHEDEEEHHIEADNAGFNDWVATADLKWALPGDGSATGSASFGVGENGFGETTYVYGVGLQKIWGAHDHGHGPEFCEDAFMLRTELIGREFDAKDEDGEVLNFDEQGVSTSLFYGISEDTTLSFRHDWVSGIDALELAEFHRYSPAFTTRLGPNKRLQARLQYDYNQSDALPSEHAGWIQFQWQWGGEIGHHDH